MRTSDTIAAIATPPGEGGVGIIRISGPEAPKIAEDLWRGKVPVANFESHKMYHGAICAAAGGARDISARETPAKERKSVSQRQDPQPLDHVLMVWMKAPNSYTGEDVIEIHGHGGAALLEQILSVVVTNGARLARPGEFTERAFLNGKMDLTQAEAVADLIHGQSELGLRLAQDQLSGRLTEEIGRIRKELIVMRAQLEAMLDFPEDEDVNVLRYDEIIERVDRLSAQISQWLASYAEGKLRREGVRVVLAGRPNVGKSSLLNALLGEDRVIVHDTAGTTRDVVEEAIQLNGLLVRLSDTAGLRRGSGEIEEEGIRRSWGQIDGADLICFVVDGSEALTKEDHHIYKEVRGRPHLIIHSKNDLPKKVSAKNLDKVFANGNCVKTSAKTGEGIDALKAAIFEHCLPHGRASDHVTIANLRHKACLDNCRTALSEVRKSAATEAGLELLAADLLVAANHLGEITGEITHDEILGEIFARFCLGK